MNLSIGFREVGSYVLVPKSLCFGYLYQPGAIDLGMKFHNDGIRLRKPFGWPIEKVPLSSFDIDFDQRKSR
jgi:hypothetical protein